MKVKHIETINKLISVFKNVQVDISKERMIIMFDKKEEN